MINNISSNISDIEIFIYDGQNNAEIIENYIKLHGTNNNWDPCLPITFNNKTSITITFNQDLIKNFVDWYPIQICNNYTTYKNEYIFDGGKSLTLNNMIINNYYNTNYSFIRSIDYFDALILCKNCSFINISSSNIQKPLFNTIASIFFYDNIFINITSSVSIIYAQHKSTTDYATRHFTFENTLFSHITTTSILNTTDSNNDLNAGSEITIENCIFNKIKMKNVIIYDGTETSDVNIINTQIEIDAGSIYYSGHRYSSNINTFNVSIITNQVSTSNEDDGLFYFTSSDITTITNTSFLYKYNATESCYYYETISNSVINATCDVLHCTNPIMAIQNDGEVCNCIHYLCE